MSAPCHVKQGNSESNLPSLYQCCWLLRWYEIDLFHRHFPHKFVFHYDALDALDVARATPVVGAAAVVAVVVLLLLLFSSPTILAFLE